MSHFKLVCQPVENMCLFYLFSYSVTLEKVMPMHGFRLDGCLFTSKPNIGLYENLAENLRNLEEFFYFLEL